MYKKMEKLVYIDKKLTYNKTNTNKEEVQASLLQDFIDNKKLKNNKITIDFYNNIIVTEKNGNMRAKTTYFLEV